VSFQDFGLSSSLFADAVIAYSSVSGVSNRIVIGFIRNIGKSTTISRNFRRENS
jgi:hypothetical protein